MIYDFSKIKINNVHTSQEGSRSWINIVVNAVPFQDQVHRIW